MWYYLFLSLIRTLSASADKAIPKSSSLKNASWFVYVVAFMHNAAAQSKCNCQDKDSLPTKIKLWTFA